MGRIYIDSNTDDLVVDICNAASLISLVGTPKEREYMLKLTRNFCAHLDAFARIVDTLSDSSSFKDFQDRARERKSDASKLRLLIRGVCLYTAEVGKHSRMDTMRYPKHHEMYDKMRALRYIEAKRVDLCRDTLLKLTTDHWTAAEKFAKSLLEGMFQSSGLNVIPVKAIELQHKAARAAGIHLPDMLTIPPSDPDIFLYIPDDRRPMEDGVSYLSRILPNMRKTLISPE